MSDYLAIDLGAESGRVMLGALAHGKLTLDELHRFPNQPVRLPNGLYWDAFRLHHEIVHGLTVAGRQRCIAPAGIAVDTWGVDFALLDRGGAPLECPRHYRDERNAGMAERLFAIVPRAEVFAATGVQIMDINSLCQLFALHLAGSAALAAADRLLFMPDLFAYWLTGVARAEITIASTSQFYDPRARRFASALLDRLGIHTRMLPELIEPGARLGTLLPHLAETTGLGPAPVYATAGHDTASAVAAVPAQGDDWCYISSGTWSLMGVELPAPVIDERCAALNFTNEAGAAGRTRLLKNIAGLWILQECRRAWAAGGEEHTYAELAEMAAAARSLGGVIDPDDFIQPGNMPHRIAEWRRARSLEPPRTKGETCRLVLESLAQRYREVLQGLESLIGRRIRVIHIVGGGSRNRLLNRLVAQATGRAVIAGPVEATAAGNILVQAIGAGEIESLDRAREIVGHSFEIETFSP